jgi:GNAT superfamily N-acetyltransferase
VIRSCDDCGLTFALDVPADVRLHRRRHDSWRHGVRRRTLAGDPLVVGNALPDGYQLTVCGPQAPRRLQDFAVTVARLANRETRYDFGVYHPRDRWSREQDVHGVLAWHGDRAIGFLRAERREDEAYLVWTGDRPIPWRPARPPRWTIGFLWIHHAHRRRGLGRALVAAAAALAGIPVSEVGWNPPFTEAGAALARSLCPDGVWLGD